MIYLLIILVLKIFNFKDSINPLYFSCFISFFGVPAALMGVAPPCEPPPCRGAPRGLALDQGSERAHWGVPLAWGAEDTCHSFRETGPWILLTVTSAGCPFVQLGVPLATADVCRAKPGGCEACCRAREFYRKFLPRIPFLRGLLRAMVGGGLAPQLPPR